MNPRFSLTLTSPQAEWLRHEAGELGVTTAELIRRLIDEARSAMPGQRHAPLLAATRRNATQRRSDK